MESIEIIGLGALVLFIGVGVGYWLGSLGRNKAALKANEAEEALQNYRGEVKEHFKQTAGHFQAIGAEYRKLYEHMSSGAVALCDDTLMSDALPAAPVTPLVEEALETVEIESETAEDTAELVDAGEDAGAELEFAASDETDQESADEAIVEEVIVDEPPRDYVADEEPVEVAPDPVIIDAEIEEPSDVELIKTEATEELIAERELVAENSDTDKTLH